MCVQSKAANDVATTAQKDQVLLEKRLTKKIEELKAVADEKLVVEKVGCIQLTSAEALNVPILLCSGIEGCEEIVRVYRNTIPHA